MVAGLLLVSCGGEGLSLAEYNTQGLAIAAAMEERLHELDAALDSETATLEDARAYWDQRIAAYYADLEGFAALEPSVEAADLHRRGLELFGKLVAAETALATRVASFEAATGPEQWWDTAEGEAVGAVEEEIYSFCLVFQSLYDRTAERVALSDVPWIPSEMKEVVQVDIGCETVRRDH